MLVGFIRTVLNVLATCNLLFNNKFEIWINWEYIATWGRSTSRQSLWAVFGRICTAQTASISQLPIRLLTSPLHSATSISYNRAILWRSSDVFMLWPWPLTNLTMNVCSTLDVTWSSTLYQIWAKSNNPLLS